MLTSIIRRVVCLRDLEGDSPEAYCKVRVWKLWGRIPFLDMADYIKFIRAHGIPFIQDKTSIVPFADDPGSCFQLKQIVDQQDNSEIFSNVNAAIILTLLASSFGIYAEVLGFISL